MLLLMLLLLLLLLRLSLGCHLECEFGSGSISLAMARRRGANRMRASTRPATRIRRGASLGCVAAVQSMCVVQKVLA